MREIKFRAWDNKDKKWLLGYEYPELGGFSMFGECMLFEEWSGVINRFILQQKDRKPEDLILMQFTGLKDKNGKEIYEGDIVMAGITIEVNDGDDFNYYATDKNGNRSKFSCSSKPSVVEYTESGYIFKHKSGKYQSFWICIKDIKEKYEKIGNIYENPELLK